MLWFIVVFGCGSRPETGPDACAAQSPEVCAEMAGCAPINGTAAVDDGAGGLCVPADAQVVVACQPEGVTCPPVEVYGVDPAAPDVCVQIPAGCMPDGWSPCADVDVLSTCAG